jgi:hypothetical protein
MEADEVTQTLHLQYVPVLEWIIAIALGLIFGGVSYFIMGGRIPFTGDPFQDAISTVAAMFSFAMLIHFFTELEMRSTVEIDFKQRYFDITNYRLYGKRVRRFHFHQIEKVRSYKRRLNFREQYFLSLVLVSRKTVKLKLPLGGDKDGAVKLIKGVNRKIRSKRTNATEA